MWSLLVLFSLVMVDVMLWNNIAIANSSAQTTQLYFFNVTQGESALTILPNDVKIMVDAGGDNKIVSELDSALGTKNDDYIDLAFISYPQLDNYEGYNYILDHYTIGAFIYNGRNDIVDTKEWSAFLQKLQAKNIPLITVGSGDSIHYDDNIINILSPSATLIRSADLTDTALVENIHMPSFSVLLASDISKNGEAILTENPNTLRAEIIKMPFSTSGILSTQIFLHVVEPKIIILSPGIKNTPSSPSKSAISAFSSSTTALILQADQGGTILVKSNNKKLDISRE
jgi:competence protein ComEC